MHFKLCKGIFWSTFQTISRIIHWSFFFFFYHTPTEFFPMHLATIQRFLLIYTPVWLALSSLSKIQILIMDKDIRSLAVLTTVLMRLQFFPWDPAKEAWTHESTHSPRERAHINGRKSVHPRIKCWAAGWETGSLTKQPWLSMAPFHSTTNAITWVGHYSHSNAHTAISYWQA